MDIAIVAPAPVPLTIGGAENLWRGLQDHINHATPHQAEIIKLPSREHEFWNLVASYEAFTTLDLRGFDVVVSGKYPGWMAAHPRHVVYLLHPLRGLYDTYHYFGLPEVYPDAPAEVLELRAFMAEHGTSRAGLPEFFARMARLHERREALPADLFVFPGPFAREIVHWLDAIGLAPERIARYGAIAHTVAGRPGYFPAGADVFVVHPPSVVHREPARGGGDHLLSVGRLDGPKRVDLLIEAMGLVRSRATLRIAGTGPEEARLRDLAAGSPRIRFEGRVSDAELTSLYAGARAVAFPVYDEDFGLVALEAMQCARPVITCTDSGGPTELIEDGVSGLVVEPTAEALAGAIDRLWSGRDWKRMGRAGLERSRTVTWDAVVAELTAVAP